MTRLAVGIVALLVGMMAIAPTFAYADGNRIVIRSDDLDRVDVDLDHLDEWLSGLEALEDFEIDFGDFDFSMDLDDIDVRISESVSEALEELRDLDWGDHGGRYRREYDDGELSERIHRQVERSVRNAMRGVDDHRDRDWERNVSRRVQRSVREAMRDLDRVSRDAQREVRSRGWRTRDYHRESQDEALETEIEALQDELADLREELERLRQRERDRDGGR